MEPRVDTPPWTGTVESLLARLETDPAAGLSSAEARRRLERDGPNRLVESPPLPWWWKFLDQFRDLVIVILLVAALLAGLVGEWIDSAAIIAIVLLNAVLSFIQENRAERALAALKNMASPHARVRRDGRIVDVEASSLVVGDLLEIEAGDRIPADARLLQAFSLQASEAALTGESVPVDKDSRSEVAAEAPIDARRNMVFMGTVATSGKAVAVAVATGMQTELGRIAGLLQQTEREPTPLQKQLAVLGKTLAAICLGLVGLILVLQILRHEELRSLLLAGNLSGFLRAPETLETFLVSISLAVAAVPEGLPAVVTVALALGVQRMVRRNALVRELSSVETLGCVQVICSDKTGTLTRNEMTVREFVTPDAAYEVTGAGYRPAGEFLRKSEAGAAAPVAPLQEPALARALEVAAWCRTAVVSALPNGEGWQVIGDPTEGALLVAARKAGVEEAPQPRMIHQIPFDSERKLMSVVVRDDRHRERMYSKGAVESLLPRCTHWLRNGAREPLDDDARRRILSATTEMAGRALRVLALAERDVDGDLDREANLTFVGLAGMIDPPRDEVRLAVATCRRAGMRPVMITGDHPETAGAIARELGIAGSEDRILAGAELDKLNEVELMDVVPRVSVFARVSANHKLRIVRAWQAHGAVVAMTGDGVNDAPAVKAADIGISMGITGTDVTKEAGVMILLDDNFATIVNAVEEGRCIYDNIAKVLVFLLSCNCGELLLMLVAALLGWPPPLLPIHLLWINLVTDGLPALALAVEKPEPGVMQRPPRPVKEQLLGGWTGLTILLQGAMVGGATLAAFALGGPNPLTARTMAFCTLVCSELFRAIGARSTRLTAPELGFFTNPALLGAVSASLLLQTAIMAIPASRGIFQIGVMTVVQWLTVLGIALLPVTVIEVMKWFVPLGTARNPPPGRAASDA